jgi:taurine dioxygenase
MTIEFRPLSEALGAEVIGVNVADDHSDETIAVIRDGWLRHKILLFRGQALTVERQKSFARRFGELTVSSIARPRIPEHPEVSVFSNIKVDGKDIGARPDRSFGDAWHSDFSFMTVPAGASFFYAQEVPENGGDDTRYANTTLAYDMLPEDMKIKLEGRCWTYSYLSTMQQHAHDFSPTTHARLFDNATHELRDVTHPFVRTHPETRQKALFIGIPDTREVLVDGMTKEEGVTFLDDLKSYATQDRFTYAHQWQPGDAILWDNRCTMHRASTFPDQNGRRLCYRVTTDGGVP